MAEANTPAPKAASNAVPEHGDHDRVAMLSLHADGTPDQHRPEIIIDREAATEAARQQFAEQAVSAADVQATNAGLTATSGTVIGKPGDEPDEVVPLTTDAAGEDPTVAKLRETHEKAAKAAGAAAEKAVKALTPDA